MTTNEFPTSAPTTSAPGARFFDRIRGLEIVRPDAGPDRWVAGVAAAVARRYGVDPLVVRIGFAVACLAGGLGVLLYGLGWMLLPHTDGRIHAQEVLTGRVTAGFVGALLAILAVTHRVIPLLVVALIVVLVVRHRRSTRPTAG
jgi:phage shock protein PspC (stress-responsive transcriptional regulator)